MTRTRKISLAIAALLCALTLGFALSACGGKDAEPTYGYGEEGTYYYTSSDGIDHMLTLGGGVYIFSTAGGSEGSGTYVYSDGVLTLYGGEEEAATASVTGYGISLTCGAGTYAFFTYEYYTVSFVFGGETLATQSVLNGKAAQDPGDAAKDGYVFLGWYADSDFTTRYEFNISITQETTIYARFVEVTGITEYKITYDFGNGETSESETVNGVVYNLPEPEQEGCAFIGWWVSATNNADELTYKYDGETLYEDTTLFAVFASGSYIGASVKDGALIWENSFTAQMAIEIAGEDGFSASYSASATDMSFPLSSVSETGKYTVTVTSGGVTETLVFVVNGLRRPSGFEVLQGGILKYDPVENADGYYVSVDCRSASHDHTLVDNGTSLYFDFSNCEMPEEGITFTVYAYADGYYYSAGSYNLFLGLGKTEVRAEDDLVSWDWIDSATEYEVYVNGELAAVTFGTEYSLSGYGPGTYEIAVRPVTKGYWSEAGDTVSYVKTSLATPTVTSIENGVMFWTEVDGAVGYKISIGGVETTVTGGGVTSLILSSDNYVEGLDLYEVTVKALAEDSADDSPYGEPLYVTGDSVGSEVYYENGTVYWQYSMNAFEYIVSVNDGDETEVYGRNYSPVTLTKSGYNEITIYFVDGEDKIYGTASVTVYAYAVVFDARGGTAYLDGEEVDTIYLAKGDAIALPEADRGAVVADFVGWYTLPDTTDDPDANDYKGDGVKCGDGGDMFVFTGNSTLVLYAAWVNPRLNIRLDAGRGTLTDEDGNVIDETVISLNGRSFSIAVPEYDDKAYAFAGWYSGPDGTGTRYTDENGEAYAAFDDITVTTLYACWAEVLSFSVTTYDGADRLSASKGPDIDLVSEVTVPETYTLGGEEMTVEVLTGSAFSSCLDLETINIPDTVIYLQITSNGYASGSGIFASTPIKNVNVYATGEPSTTREIIYYSESGVLFWINTNSGDVELLYYPYGRTDETYSVPEYVYNENELELDGSREVQAVHHVNAIGGSVFRGHTEIKYMSIPEYVTTIGAYCFYQCTSLTVVDFECEVEKIEDYMFYGCTALTGFDISYTVKEIGNYAFYNCTGFTDFVIPDNVETLGTYVFANCTSLISVTLSQNLTVINDRDFASCTSLKGVEIPYGVTAINQYAFNADYDLAAVSIPSSVKTIGDRAFQSCSSLKSVYVPDTVESLGTYVFDGCSSMTSAHIPSTLTAIPDYAFRNCYMLSEINIPDTVTSIGSNAFYQDYSLKTITIPASVTLIDSAAFRCCYGLVEIYNMSSLDITAGDTSSENGYIGSNAMNVYTPTLGESHIAYADGMEFIYDAEDDWYLVGYEGTDPVVVLPESMGGKTYEVYKYSFYGRDDITSVTVTSGVTAIGERAFYNCSSIASLTLAEGLTEIGTYAFYQNTSLTTLILPESLTTIDTYAFSTCTSLVTVTIGSNIESIGSNAFSNCYKLVEVRNLSDIEMEPGVGTGNGSAASNAVYIYGADGESHLVYKDGYLFIYDADGKYYLAAYYGDEKDLVLPDDIDGNEYEINKYAFYQNDTIESIVIPDSVTVLGDRAFYECTSLSDVTMSNGVTTISTYAFYGCSSLESIAIPDSVTSIASYAFYNCTALKNVSFGRNVASIANYAFRQCTALESIAIPDSVTDLGGYVFMNCTALKRVTLGAGVSEVPTCLFQNCESLIRVVIPEGVTSIGTYAFTGCSSLRSVEVPSSVTTMGSYVFRYCYAMESFVIPDTVTSVGTYLFQDCTGLRSVTIGSGITEIPANMFNGCSSLRSVDLHSGITSIGDQAFYNCTALTSVTMRGEITSIGEKAFYGTAIYNDPNNWEDGMLYYGVYLLAGDSTAAGDLSVRDGTYLIANAAFKSNTAITSVTLPDSVVYLGDSAFESDSGIVELSLGDGLLYIGYRAFYNCTKLSEVTIPDSVETIGDYAFYGLTGVTSLTLGQSVKTIGDYAFYNFRSIRSLVIPDSVETIGDYAFYYNWYIGTLVIGGGVKSIGDSAFRECSRMTSIVMGGGIEEIGDYAFYNCSALETVYYCGTEAQWNALDVGTDNECLTGAAIYYYSDTEPASDGNFWHYVDGEVVVWKKD